jgi:hypothetical protein
MTAIKLALCLGIALVIASHSEWWAGVFLMVVLALHIFQPVIRWLCIGWLVGEGIKLSRRRARHDPDDDFPGNLP